MKKLASRFGMVVFGLVVCAVVGVGSQALEAGPRPCFRGNCLDVWDPVTCSNGVTYSNSCYAARACATGCVPSGGI